MRRDLFENDRYLIQVAFIHPFVEKQILGGDNRSLRQRTGVGFRPVSSSQNPTRDVFVDLNAESQRDLLSDSRAAPGRIPLLHFNNRVQ